MKNILIPTDFSENAWNAIHYAMRMFAAERCTFFLLNTFTPAVPRSRFLAPLSGDSIEGELRLSSETLLKDTVGKIKEKYSNNSHKFRSISSFNLLVDEISDLVRECSIDLIITGTRGASGMREVFMGSNTVNIIKHVKSCPVLAVPKNYRFIKPKEIAFATDFNHCYSQPELAPLLDFANNLGATIRVVYVQETICPLSKLQQFNLDTLRKLLKSEDYYIQTVSEVDSVTHTLKIFTQELEVQLLVMLNYHHSQIEKMTREPIVKRTAFHTKIPLLVLPEFDVNQVGFSPDSRHLSER